MTDEIHMADWATLFREIPAAIQQLESDEAHCAHEVARLLDCALYALKAVNPVRAWDQIVPMIGYLVIGYLAVHANDKHGESLPQDTRNFLDRVEDAFSDWNCTVRDTNEVMGELYVRGARKPDSRPN